MKRKLRLAGWTPRKLTKPNNITDEELNIVKRSKYDHSSVRK